MYDQLVQALGGLVSVGGRPLTADELDAIETAWKLELPGDYKSFATRWSGLAWSEEVGYPFGDAELAPVSFFYGGGDKPHLRLDKAIADYHRRIPRGWIPIAEEAFGNQICLRAGVGGGQVALWDHHAEDPTEEAPAPLDSLTVVGDSFDSWLRSLRLAAS